MTLSDSDHTRQQFVKVFQFRDLSEALVIKGLLESSGIKCLLGDENTVRMDWFWSNAIGGVKLWVRAEDEDAARSLLRSAPEKMDAPKGQIPKPGASHRYASSFAFTGLLVGILVLSSSYFFYTRPNRKMPDGLAAIFAIICPSSFEEAMLEREHYVPVGANWFFVSLQNAMLYGLVGFALGHTIQTRRDTVTHVDL
jgi:hypothetical protein